MITLKKLKIYKSRSKETVAFMAELYFDKKHIGFAENEGKGDAVFCWPASGQGEGFARARLWCESQPDRTYTYRGKEYKFETTLENYVEQLVLNHCLEREQKEVDKKLITYMPDHIIYKINNKIKFFKIKSTDNWPIEKYMEFPQGYNLMVNLVREFRKLGATILNTNLGDILDEH